MPTQKFIPEIAKLQSVVTLCATSTASVEIRLHRSKRFARAFGIPLPSRFMSYFIVAAVLTATVYGADPTIAQKVDVKDRNGVSVLTISDIKMSRRSALVLQGVVRNVSGADLTLDALVGTVHKKDGSTVEFSFGICDVRWCEISKDSVRTLLHPFPKPWPFAATDVLSIEFSFASSWQSPEDQRLAAENQVKLTAAAAERERLLRVATETQRLAAEEQARKDSVKREEQQRSATADQAIKDKEDAERLLLSNVDPQAWRKQLKSGATLASMRRIFLNQHVVIGGPVVNLRGNVLLEWTVASQDGTRYRTSPLDSLAGVYKGKTGTVVAVQLNELKRNELRPNALGERINEDDVADPYFDLVVRLDDGHLAMTTAYPITLTDQVDLASAAVALSLQMARQLPRLVGGKVYAVGFSKLYKPDTTLEDMIGGGGVLQQLSSIDVPMLVPLEILAARYIELTGIVFKLKLPNGEAALAFTPLISYRTTDVERPFFERVAGRLLVEIPKELTAKDIDAIKHGAMYRGMDKDTLPYSLGVADTENDWGRGGRQLIYYGGGLVVYTDQKGKVTDWQILNKK